MKFTVHTLVKNEDQWVEYALKSVLPYAEQILVYDTGSTDKTVEMIKSIKSAKIVFEEKGEKNKQQLIDLRREQLEKTKTDWFLILDGDEIWPQKELEKLLECADKSPKDTVAIINSNRNCIGDIYHYLPQSAGHYSIAGKVGNITIRLIKKTSDLQIKGEYPLEAFYNQDGEISKQDKRLVFCDSWYLHTTFLKRSSRDHTKNSGSLGKTKLPEWGNKMTTQELPEVLKEHMENNFNNPLRKRSLFYNLAAFFITPLVIFKRTIK